MIDNLLNFSFKVDEFAIIMIALVAYIGMCVFSFALRYMNGDKKYCSFFVYLIMLVACVGIMVSTDNIWLLVISCCCSHLFLVRLMIHKPNWKAAKASGIIAAKNYVLSAFFMGIAFVLLYLNTGETSINAIMHQHTDSTSILLASAFIILAAMAQSAIWPFHKWLISSLNSPTPISAIMHAGLINGGGFLLVRFAPLYLENTRLLLVLFFIGIITSLLGTLWKLMQNDVKRMLACSTMGQMGFMFVQCGLGLFPAAVAHLVWHGMFKAYLFLASSSAAQEKRFHFTYPPTKQAFICSLVCGMAGSFSFAYTSGKSWIANDTTLVLVVIAFLAGSQLTLPILRIKPIKNLSLAIITATITGLIYGYSVSLITHAMKPMGIMQPQPLNGFYILGIITLILAWLFTFFVHYKKKTTGNSTWALKCYVHALNASQPHASTVTAHHNHYQYL